MIYKIYFILHSSLCCGLEDGTDSLNVNQITYIYNVLRFLVCDLKMAQMLLGLTLTISPIKHPLAHLLALYNILVHIYLHNDPQCLYLLN